VVPVVDGESRLVGVLSATAVLSGVADNRHIGGRPVVEMDLEMPPIVGPEASITDAVLAIGAAGSSAIAMTADGTATGRLLTVVTSRDLAPAFGDQPAAILHDIRHAEGLQALGALNRRARACALQHLTDAGSTDWVTRFTALVDIAVIARVIALTGESLAGDSWCWSGTAGRGELITKQRPQLVLIHDERVDGTAAVERHKNVVEALAECDYLSGVETKVEQPFFAASPGEWSRRYAAWIQNPVMEGMARNRALFDLRPIHGPRGAWEHIRQAVAQAVDRDIVQVLAHDCLASLPPLTFFQDAVVEQSGEQTTVFRLEHSALRPLVDVGRVFGMAGRDVMGTSTLDRFAIARRLLPAHESIFRDASQTLRIVLWQQGRIGISRGTSGSELPPALLSRHDRHMLKSGFPAIHRLLEFTAEPAWLDAMS
jgi:CBS domain-containing protein